ncbi:MAG TPA: lamin tail domain-containing protein, partial [Planctomycetota bacterium]|nr:lamin tail domain-containing protein [Planctomycetota bacterium]
VEDDMAGVGTSAYIRVPFEIEDPDEIVGLVLRMRYDDGFVAFLNGVEIARANAPSSLSWSSAATGLHDDAAAVQFDSHDVSAHLGALRAGLNVLAIHGLNDSVTSSDFLIEPELLGSLAFEGSGISIDGPVHIIARASTGDAVWSGPSVASYVTEPDLPLRISEIHYHPAALEEGSPYDEEDLEFIELANLSSGPIHLAGVKLEEGIRFTFADTIVPGGGFVVLVHDREAFEWFWGDAIPVVGEYSGNLSNAGERIRLVNGAGNVIHDFTFEDDWVPETDGVGFSLVASDLFADPEEWGSPGFWRRSEEIDGSPGRGEGGASSSGRRRPGDSNGDAGVDLSDAVHLLRLLFDGSGIELPCGGTFADPANVIVLDVNGDESTDLADAISLLSWLFTSGPPPARGTSCIAIEGCTNACL